MFQARSHLLVLICLATALAAAGVPAQSAPPEFCVSCTGPQAQYRCTFSDDVHVAPQGGLQLYCITTLAREGGHQSCAVDRQSERPCNGTPKVLALPAGAPDDGVKETVTPPPSVTPPDAAPAGSTAPANANAGQPQNPPTGNAGAQAPASSKTWSDSSGAPASPPKKDAEGDAQKGATQEADQKGPADDAGEPATVVEPVEKAGKAVSDAAKKTGKVLEDAGSAVGHAAKKTWKCLTTLFGDC